jgi:hypothetical protein
LLIPLLVPAVGLRFILKLFFSITLGEDPAHWSPCSLHNELNFGLLISLPVPAVGLRFILKKKNSITLGEDLACWSPCSLHNELSFGLLYPCGYRQGVWDRFMLCESLVMQKPPNPFIFLKFIDSLEIHILIIHDSCQLEFWRK